MQAAEKNRSVIFPTAEQIHNHVLGSPKTVPELPALWSCGDLLKIKYKKNNHQSSALLGLLTPHCFACLTQTAG